MTPSNFKTFALAIAALFTFALTSCDENEIANLTPSDLTEVKSASFSLDPHDLIADENAIDKPYNNLGQPYHDFSNALSGDTHAGIPKPPGPVFTEEESRRPDVNKPSFKHDDLKKIVREDIGPLYTHDAENKVSLIDKPSKPVKPAPVSTEADLKIRQDNLIDGELYEDGISLNDRDGWPIK